MDLGFDDYQAHVRPLAAGHELDERREPALPGEEDEVARLERSVDVVEFGHAGQSGWRGPRATCRRRRCATIRIVGGTTYRAPTAPGPKPPPGTGGLSPRIRCG